MNDFIDLFSIVKNIDRIKLLDNYGLKLIKIMLRVLHSRCIGAS
jgi:hypothetical protein